MEAKMKVTLTLSKEDLVELLDEKAKIYIESGDVDEIVMETECEGWQLHLKDKDRLQIHFTFDVDAVKEMKY